MKEAKDTPVICLEPLSRDPDDDDFDLYTAFLIRAIHAQACVEKAFFLDLEKTPSLFTEAIRHDGLLLYR